MTTNHSILAAFEDAEQAHALAHPPMTLYFTEQGLILNGSDRGQDIGEVAQRIITDHITAGRTVGFQPGTARPWWRLWRLTETMTVTVTVQAEGFGQAFDDGGHL